MARFDVPLPHDDGRRIPPARARKLLVRMLALAKPQWKSLSLGLVCLVIASLANLVFPQAIRVLVDGALARTRAGGRSRGALHVRGRHRVGRGRGDALRPLHRRRRARRRRPSQRRVREAARAGDRLLRRAQDGRSHEPPRRRDTDGASERGERQPLDAPSQLRRCPGWRRDALLHVAEAHAPHARGGAGHRARRGSYGRRVRRLSRDVQDALGRRLRRSAKRASSGSARCARSPPRRRRPGATRTPSRSRSTSRKRRTVITGTFMGVAMLAATRRHRAVMGTAGGSCSQGA